MSLAVPSEKCEEFLALARKMSVEATILGTFNDSGMFHVRYGDKTVAYLGMEFLHDGVPRMRLNARWVPPRHEEPSFPEPDDMGSALKEMLARLNICSKESVVRQYDHEVQRGRRCQAAGSVLQTTGPVMRPIIRPILDSFEGVVVAKRYLSSL